MKNEIKLSDLIKVFRAAKKQFGDVPVRLLNSETGNWENVAEVLKLHPYTTTNGCLNRADPVNAVALVSHKGFSDDLTLLKNS